jgi:protein arginine kinase
VKGLTQAERDYYVGARLVSADFPWTLPHRMLAVDAGLRLGLMVNEEDHFRLQSISPGWTPAEAEQNGASLLGELGKNARFATFGEGGFIAASPPNGGRGIRLSAMTHLIGLAATGKLNSVAAALRAQGIAVRGLFGETSRAVGAFAQVSVLNGNIQDLAGAVTYLIDAERDARAQFGEAAMRERVEKASKLATGSRLLSLANALRVLAWWRWQALVADNDPRIVDRALASLEIRDAATDEDASVSRAAILRSVAEIISQTDKWG